MLRIARLLAATHSGVLPLLLAALTFASWRSRTRSVVTPSLAAARCSGVALSLSRALAHAPDSSKNLTMAALSATSEAACRAVVPRLSLASSKALDSTSC